MGGLSPLCGLEFLHLRGWPVSDNFTAIFAGNSYTACASRFFLFVSCAAPRKSSPAARLECRGEKYRQKFRCHRQVVHLAHLHRWSSAIYNQTADTSS